MLTIAAPESGLRAARRRATVHGGAVTGAGLLCRRSRDRLLPVSRSERGPGNWSYLLTAGAFRAIKRCSRLLARLFDNLGTVIPYKDLCLLIGHKSANSAATHVLRQYTAWLRGVLMANKAPYVITVARDVGYGLCKMGGDPRLTATSRSATLPELGTKSSARAHRGRANSNGACEAIWHSPFICQRPGSRPTQPHRSDPATFGKSPWSDTYSFLSVTRGDPLAPSSHSRTAALFVIRTPDSTWRLSPHAEHVSERGRVAASASPTWPQEQATLTSTIAPRKIAPADTGAEVPPRDSNPRCARDTKQRGSCSCQDQITPRARMALQAALSKAHSGGGRKSPRRLPGA